MSVEQTFEKRATQLVAEIEQSRRQERYDAFEALGTLVDQGELTWDQVFAIQKKLGPVALVETVEHPE